MEGTQPLYKRVLIKLSGEALSAGQDGILNYTFLEKICAVIKRCVDMGVEVSIVAVSYTHLDVYKRQIIYYTLLTERESHI